MKSLSPFNKLIWLCFFIIGALLCFRVLYSGSLRYIFMTWNIFLAWVPYVIASQLISYKFKSTWQRVFLFCSWLLFFPNALYIVTDLVHLRADTNVPWWFDAMFLFLNAFVGLLLAFGSLVKIESFLREHFSRRIVNVLVPALLFFGSYGVYLGRFERWNSWNIVDDPFSLLSAIFLSVANPIENWRVWAISILFTIVYALLFYSLKVLPAVINQNKNAGD